MNPSDKIDGLIDSLADWRGPMLARLRQIFHEVDPEVAETWKWMGTPVWEHDGIIAAGMAFKTSIKLGFLYGASLPDPDNLFNTELEGNQRRGIKYFKGDAINEAALKTLIRAGITYNQAKKK
jgi:hypothetical protein